MATAAGGVLGPLAWIYISVIYLAEIGVNFRRYKRGAISKEEFVSKAKTHTVGTVGSICGGIAGSTIGFLIGSALFPIAGTIIGTALGGIAGSIAGKKLA
jgi:hypothetical protein